MDAILDHTAVVNDSTAVDDTATVNNGIGVDDCLRQYHSTNPYRSFRTDIGGIVDKSWDVCAGSFKPLYPLKSSRVITKCRIQLGVRIDVVEVVSAFADDMFICLVIIQETYFRISPALSGYIC